MKQEKTIRKSSQVRLLLIAFFTVVAVGSGLSYRTQKKLALPPVIAAHPAFFSGLDPKLAVPEIIDPTIAKAKGLFWVGRSDARGSAFRLLDDADYFEEAFPGYAAARQHSKLWRKYFTRHFEPSGMWLPRLNASGERLLGFTGGGCDFLFAEYSADVVFFGSSQMYRGVVPAVLGPDLKNKLALEQSPKLLMCAEPSASPHQVKNRAGDLEKTGKRARVAVWAYSPWFAMEKEPPKRGYRDFLNFLFSPSHHARSYLPLLSWSTLVPATQMDVKVITSAPIDLRKDTPATDPETVSEGFGGFYFKRELATDESKVRELARRAPTGTLFYEKKEPFVCDFEHAKRVVRGTVDSLLGVADHVILFVAPGTEFFKGHLPQCLVENVEGLLTATQSERVRIVRNFDGAASLTYTDFVYTFSGRGHAFFDGIHQNYRGALKSTRLLAQTVAAAWNPPASVTAVLSSQ